MTNDSSIGTEKKYKILLLEDVESDAEIVKDTVLTGGINAEFIVASTEKAFISSLVSFSPDLVLADYTLTNFDGLTALKIVRKQDTLIPFIFITGTLSIAKAVDTLHHGATDFILKENIGTLPKAIIRSLRELKYMLAVKEVEKRFHIMANSAPVMIWMADEQNQAMFLNRTMFEYTGLEKPDEHSIKWTELVHEQDRQEVIEKIQEGFTNGEEFTIECRFRKFDDEYFWFYTKGIPHTDSRGNFVGFVYSAIDFSDQKKLNKEKDSFLGIASHELKTPLTTIKAYNQLLVRLVEQSDSKTPDEQLLTYLQETGKSIERMKTLINGLLDVSRIQLRQDEYLMERTSFCPLIRHVADSFKLDDDLHKIIIDCDEEVYVKADSEKLIQVFTNLIENAIKYSPEGGNIQIKVKNSEHDALISICDQGIGMNDEDINRIFDRFFRSEKDSSKYPGLGIGLYLVSQIVKAHQGRVWAHSEPGKGAEFFVSLPLFLENGKNTNG
ncbi:MAG: ATP-binding protein [Cyclobacteriaceae bacterium]